MSHNLTSANIPRSNQVVAYSPISNRQNDFEFHPDPSCHNLKPAPYAAPSNYPIYTSEYIHDPSIVYQQPYNPTGLLQLPYQYPPVYPLAGSYAQPVSMRQVAPLPQVVVPKPRSKNRVNNLEFTDNERLTFKQGQVAKCGCVTSAVFDVLIAVVNPQLLFLIVFNLIGYVCTVRYSKCIGTMYLMFLTSMIAMKIAYIAIIPNPLVVVAMGVGAIINITALVGFVKFTKLLRKLSSSELMSLKKKLENKIMKQFCCFW